MIKNLISDLIHKKISLSEALTRAKLISLEINNETFRNWLKRELEGYNYDDEDLPLYRQIYSPMYLEVVVRNGQEMSFQVFAPESVSKKERQILEIHRELGPITAIEKLIDDLTGSTARMNIPTKLHQTLYQFLTNHEKAQIKLNNFKRKHRLNSLDMKIMAPSKLFKLKNSDDPLTFLNSHFR